jgi:hypothetical protein
MRNRVGLQHQASGLRDRLELEDQTRLADPWFAHRRYDLAMTAFCQLQRPLHLLQLGLASDEPGQTALRRDLQSRPQRPQPGYLDHVNRLAHPLDSGRPQRFEVEVPFTQLSGLLGDGDRTGRRQRLHPCRQAGRVPDRRILVMRVTGLDRSHHHFAGVDPNPRLHGKISSLTQFYRVAAQLLLHPQRCVERALGMILMGDGRAEQGEDAVAGRLHDVAVVAVHRVDHQLQRRIDDRSRLLGVEVLHQLHRTLDVGE